MEEVGHEFIIATQRSCHRRCCRRRVAFALGSGCRQSLAARHKLPPRHLETLLQGLVHAKILKGVRGPRGGYELARERRRISVGEIVRTAMSLSTADPDDLGANSVLLERVIDPAVRRAGETFLANLDAITVEQMCETAEKTHVLDDEKVSGDFAI